MDVVTTHGGTQYFVLNEDRRPVLATRDQWMALPVEKRLVAETRVSSSIRIATSFEGVLFFEDEPDGPHLFETIVIFDECDDDRYSYATWEDAEKGHADLVKRYRELCAGVPEQPQEEPAALWLV